MKQLTRKRASNSGIIRLPTPNSPRGDAHNHVTPERREKQAGKRRSAAVHGSDEDAGDRGAAMAEQHPKGKQEVSSFFPQTPICPTRKSCVCTAIAGRSNAASRSANPCSNWARNSTASAMT